MEELEAETNPRVEVATDAGGNALVRIGGDLDISGIDALEARVAPVLAQHPAKLTVDAAGLRFADSSAIALWVRWATIVDDFELRNPSPLLRRVVTAMGLAEKLAVTP
jgi:anti-anti-sigma factor